MQQKVCNAFLEAANFCDPENTFGETLEFMETPTIVCTAFSIEIGLKIILSGCGISAKGHNLLNLYLKIPLNYQLQIFEGTEFSKEDFFRHLSHAKYAFNEWRYVFEAKDIVSVNSYFLGKLALAVQYVSEKISIPR